VLNSGRRMVCAGHNAKEILTSSRMSPLRVSKAMPETLL
jgi:hypothetical protein